MSLTKLGSYAIRFTHQQPLIRRLTAPKIQSFFIPKNDRSTKPPKTENEVDDLDKPVRYSTSQAASWDAVSTRMGSNGDEFLWYQPIVVTASTIIFMVYFFILREENDIDEQLSWSLGDHFPSEMRKQLEESQQIPEKYAKEGATAFKK